MKIVRSDKVGTVDMKLIRRPTNTCAWIDNWHLYAAGSFETPIVRFMGTSETIAIERYTLAVREAQSIFSKMIAQ